MNNYWFHHILVVLGFFISTAAFGQTFEYQVDSLLNNKYPDNAPGAAFLIAKEGKIIYKNAFGLADLELSHLMETDNVFEIGSMTKQFTAISVLMLVEEGKLGLNDEITKFIPDYPTHGYKITIHHLLSHTSGIKNYTSIRAVEEIATEDLTPHELIDFFKNEPMDFMPGEQFKYSNSGYVLLGQIIELVSQQTYESYVQSNIFEKLELTHSQYADHRKLIAKRASGYHKKDEHYINPRYISFTIPYSAGALMSTVEDMFAWQEAINNRLLINEETTEKAFTKHTLNSGEPINYGYGWHLKEINGARSFEHGGSIFGFKSMGVYLPDSDIYVIGLSNCDCNSPTKIARQLAELASNN